jgi:hypothetical protein
VLKDTLDDMDHENKKLKVKVDELTQLVKQRQDVISNFEVQKQSSTQSMMEMLCKSLFNQQFGHVINNNYSAPQ